MCLHIIIYWVWLISREFVKIATVFQDEMAFHWCIVYKKISLFLNSKRKFVIRRKLCRPYDVYICNKLYQIFSKWTYYAMKLMFRWKRSYGNSKFKIHIRAQICKHHQAILQNAKNCGGGVFKPLFPTYVNYIDDFVSEICIWLFQSEFNSNCFNHLNM